MRSAQCFDFARLQRAQALGRDPRFIARDNDPLPQKDHDSSAYYASAPEESRLVLDVGGAAGAYAFWLADRRYGVSLIDAVHWRVRISPS